LNDHMLLVRKIDIFITVIMSKFGPMPIKYCL
jgi:hypothetical protein